MRFFLNSCAFCFQWYNQLIWVCFPCCKFWSPTYFACNSHTNMILFACYFARKKTYYPCSQVICLWSKGDNFLLSYVKKSKAQNFLSPWLSQWGKHRSFCILPLLLLSAIFKTQIFIIAVPHYWWLELGLFRGCPLAVWLDLLSLHNLHWWKILIFNKPSG